jgi:integrase
VKATALSTSTVQRLPETLNRVINRAMARDQVKRNVVVLCEVPKGTIGRPSNSLTLSQANAVLDAAEGYALHAYVVVSLLTGARTEELRALTWDLVDLDGRPNDKPPRPPSIQVWRSVRESGDTKTRSSRRTLALPGRAVDALCTHRDRQQTICQRAESKWHQNDLVFASRVGTGLYAGNVRRSFRLILEIAGLDPHGWTPRELRHSFVSILSDSGVSIEDIAELCGHAGTRGDRERLPPPAAADRPGWCCRDGSNLRPAEPGQRTGSHSDSHSPMKRGHVHRWDLAAERVGDSGIEPVTSSVSAKRNTVACGRMRHQLVSSGC